MTLGHIKTDRGFTLIELLVVIAIIGILSSVVLASLNTARNRGSDAAIQSQMTNIRTQAEIFYDTGNTYGTAGTSCTAAVFADTQIAALITKTNTDNGTSADVTCNNTTTAWAAQVQLRGGEYFCVDSTGAAKKTTAVHVITDQRCD